MFHPFLCYGGPIPIVRVGTFGEVNKTVDNRDAMIAKLCSKDTSRAVDLPSSNESISRSYGHHQESVPPWALGVQFMKANARLRLERLHLVGSAPAEAASLAANHKTLGNWNFGSDCPSWFTQHCNK
jgi:hypothetical protein